ncbi:hypothetical protein HYQ44_019636 [Verticillium longisporum]|nr:hypothetical protein HYQ44_019636 [Verticillium longisporum]
MCHLPILFSFDSWSSTWYRYPLYVSHRLGNPKFAFFFLPAPSSSPSLPGRSDPSLLAYKSHPHPAFYRRVLSRPSQAAPLTPSIKAQELSYI